MKNKFKKGKKISIALAIIGSINTAIPFVPIHHSNLFYSTGYAAETVIDEGEKVDVEANQVFENGIVNNEGQLEIKAAGTAKDVVVNSGGILSIQNGGSAKENITLNEGYVFKGSTGARLEANFEQVKIEKNKAVNLTLNKGAEFTVESGGYASNTTINEGGLMEVQNGGGAHSTVIKSGGIQNVYAGADVTMTDCRGIQNVLQGAQVDGGNIFEGGEQHVYGTGYLTELRGGWQYIHDGGVVTETNVTGLDGGGKQVVLKGGKLEDSRIFTRGLLAVEAGANVTDISLYKGSTIQMFLTSENAVNNGKLPKFELGNLKGTAKIYVSEKQSAPGRELIIDNLKGFADFVVNTDLANNKSDHITIKNAQDSLDNTLSIQYDPSADLGKVISGNAAVEVVDAAAGMGFKAKENQIGAYSYIPVLSQKDGKWYVERIEITGASDSVHYAAGLNAYTLALMRDSDLGIETRLANLRAEKETTGLWANIDRGQQKIANDGRHNIKGNYSNLQLGYDTFADGIGGRWLIGTSLSYIDGHKRFTSGSGSDKGLILGVYGSLKGNDGQFIDFNLRGGKLDSKYDYSMANGINGMISGDYDNQGVAMSAAYGIRKPFSKTWYFEPQVKLAYTALDGADYVTDDNAKISQKKADSLYTKLGFTVGSKLPGGDLYMKVAYGKEFSGEYGVDALSNGLGAANVRSDIKGTWFEYGLGFKLDFGKEENLYAEVGKIGSSGDEVEKEWHYQIGVNLKF